VFARTSRGTLAKYNAERLERLLRVSLLERIIPTSLAKTREADTVEGALRDYANKKETHERALAKEARWGLDVVRAEGLEGKA
jgi:hypothetical protein